MKDAKDKKKDRTPAWVPVSKSAAKLFPVDSPFTEVEALVSLQLNHNNGSTVTVIGLAKSWGWSRKRVATFLRKVGVEIVYPQDTSQIRKQRGYIEPKKGALKEHKKVHINFIDYRYLQGKGNIKGSIKGGTIHEKEKKRRKTDAPDSLVKAFQHWWMEKFEHKFKRPFQVASWPQFSAEVKKLLQLDLSWEDLQYITMEFFLDDDPFLAEKAGHTPGMLLKRVGQNVYKKYLDPEFREKNSSHIVSEQGEPLSERTDFG
jgi:hypothetical protein